MTSALEYLIAHTILQGFDAQYGRFLEITAGAQQRFEQAQWYAVQDAMKQRINLYDHHVTLAVAQLKSMSGDLYSDPHFVMRVKSAFETLLHDYPRYEIAESFFNSVYCRIFSHRNLKPHKLFVFSSQTAREDLPQRPLDKTYTLQRGIPTVLAQILDDMSFTLPWESLTRDIEHISRRLSARFDTSTLAQASITTLREPFFRNKAAYLIGRINLPNQCYAPFVLPIHHNQQGGIFVDTCLTEFDDISIVFGFARSYFMVHAPVPSAVVRWLQTVLPAKTQAELYTAIGCQKHGKTEFYREYLRHLDCSDDPFIIAPGIKGMVMLVFTLPSYDTVFKVIKDRFAPQKEMTRETVKSKYRLVKEHDRVGRMADTQEYENFVLPRQRVCAELLDELRREAPSMLEENGDELIIRHLYMERRMTPLNIYLEQADEAQLRQVLDEYGSAIKQLAAANIFPGDMLFKNFGVTRHGRVVFYDYDEINYMTEMNFRDIPAPRNLEDEMAAEPWYSVGPLDIFPEEFRTFLCINPQVKRVFEELHGDLFEARYWRDLQQKIEQGHIEDVFPYHRKLRFSRN
ncbi:bifunctional isocitrate dehydrogenase kinase/phosphatase [Plesiomonas sp.]|uniref:bifunctional isocitrate dehydrogenase kinase/phosphatase n=1 Tax=Plesiomonas sp. TaxID=2486279 RepID=UPI003F2E32A4